MKKLYQVGKEVDFMPNILPVSDLRNYNEVLKNCQVGEPLFLTKNGREEYVEIYRVVNRWQDITRIF